ncbi:C-type lectin lectoxin-Lio2 [Stomoxys calcitrans]|uniref:C-type lectin lectoxin-Lio2 n=1 Tax=Stomoxys calcitrans TaxID=35570 RepID=UPI0027E3AA48|nr:C-type lectin lectoxin-Lio2 [Stomoxys calcitrans]
MSRHFKILILFAAFALLNGHGVKANDDVDVDADTAVTADQISARFFNQPVLLGDKEYFIGAYQKLNWHRANQLCALGNMSLTAIESSTERDLLSTYLYSKKMLGKGYWISGSNLADPNTYTWSQTGRNFFYTAWQYRQPPAGPTRYCVQTNGQFYWTTSNCLIERYFICSRPLEPACGANGNCYYAGP